jgi:hypothetical protein
MDGVQPETINSRPATCPVVPSLFGWVDDRYLIVSDHWLSGICRGSIVKAISPNSTVNATKDDASLDIGVRNQRVNHRIQPGLDWNSPVFP